MHGATIDVHAPVQAAVPTKGDSRAHNDGFNRRPRRRNAERHKKRVALIATLAALSAVIFTVYTCSLLIRSRIHTSSFGRRLAEKWGGKDSDTDTETCSASSPSSDIDDSSSPEPLPLRPRSVGDMGRKVPMYSKDRALKQLGIGIWRDEASQSKESKVRTGAKRKAHEALHKSGDSSEFDLEPPQKGSPLAPAPILDPAIDLLIDSVLAAGEDVVLSSPGQRHEALAPVDPAVDSSTESVTSEESGESFESYNIQGEETFLPLDAATDSLIDSVLAGGKSDMLDSLGPVSEAAMAPLDTGIDFLIESLMAREEEELLSDLKAHDGQPLSPLDAGVDALIDSVLAGGKTMLLFEAQRIVEGEMDWDEGDSSSPVGSQFAGDGRDSDDNSDDTSTAEMKSETALSSPKLGTDVSSRLDPLSSVKTPSHRGSEGLEADDWLDEAEGGSQSAEVLPSTSTVPELPKGRGKPMEVISRVSSFLFGHGTRATRAQVDQEPPPVLEGERDLSSSISTEGETTKTFPDASSAIMPVASGEGQETKESVVSSAASSSGASAALPVSSGPPGAAVLQQTVARQQSTSWPPLVVPRRFLTWLQSVYPGVPDQVLLTHPLYHSPKRQMLFRMKSFNVGFAAALRSFNFNPISVLGECRILFQKPWLHLKDYEALMAHAERLCGYASGCMPVKTGSPRLRKVIDSLATILMVLDTLHCLTELLGNSSKKEAWWPWIVDHIESARFTPYVGSRLRKRSKELDLAVSLDFAVECYRRGRRPPPRLLIGLKEALLFGSSTTKFASGSWDAWREDVLDWRKGLPGNEQAGEGSAQPLTSSKP